MNNIDKTINLGLQLLRLISCFWVVINHCYYSGWNVNLKYFLYQKPFHVPCFMFMSFYFFYKHIIKREVNKIKQRFQRLIIPYVIWPFIFLLINNLGIKYFGNGKYGKYISVKDYFYQIITGTKYFPIFWYLTVLLLFSNFFTIIAFIIPHYFLFFIHLFAYFFYGIHLSSLYDYLIKNNLFTALLVLSIRIFPIAVIGLIFGSYNLIFCFKKHYIRNIILNSSILYLIIKYNIFTFKNIYIYQDVGTNTIASFNLFCIFGLIPFENIKNKTIISIIRHITNYTGGIYYLHPFTSYYLQKIFINVRKKNLFGIFLIYIYVYIICFLGNKLLSTNKIKYLFN